jgi:beta-xylosidase
MLKASDIRIRDPFIVVEEDAYYLFGSTDINSWSGKAESFLCYRSHDLIHYEYPVAAFLPPAGFWSDIHYWAPEVHTYKGRYYMFASFKAEGRSRGTQILLSNHVQGPYLPITEGPFTPSQWECLDGTLYIENEIPYAIFCHEWVQVGDGEICAVQLSVDLKSMVGEPTVLFTASQAPWVVSHETLKDGTKAYVTDGPYLHRMKDDSLLMLWSSFSSTGYAIGQAKSENGVLGPWKQVEEPLFANDGGHGMLFKKKDGSLWLTIHTPNDLPNERPVYVEMEEINGLLRKRVC